MNIRSIGISSIVLFALVYSDANAGEPCCNITAINARTGIVTAHDPKTRQSVEFKVTGATLIKSLKVGQAVYVDYGTQKISVDPSEPCCNITQIRPDK